MKKRHTPEQIVRKLRGADAELAAGTSIPEVATSGGDERERVRQAQSRAQRPRLEL